MDELDEGSRVTRLSSFSTRQVIAALRKAGFEDAPKRGKGSHHALVLRKEQVRLVIVPERKNIPTGTLRAIIRQAGMTVSKFLALIE
jgi:predicted RNA binding protein YcfA (HicA-like mRNA interferase family)